MFASAGIALAGPGDPQGTERQGTNHQCAGEPADIVGTPGNDQGAGQISGTAGNDVIVTLGGADTVSGGRGNDTICARLGDDRANGGKGDDLIRGGGGDDVIFGGDGSDRLLGGKGEDELYGEKGQDELAGGPQDDICDGGPGQDTLANSCEEEVQPPQNNPPAAADDSGTTDEDTETTVDVLQNDTDPDGDGLSIDSLDESSTDGDAEITGGGISYDPDGAFDALGSGDTDTDTVTYTADDGRGGTDTATLTVTISGVEDDPVASDDTDTVSEDDSPQTIDVLANDSDPDGGAITITSVTQPTNGTVVITNSGQDVTYEPDDDYCNDPGAAPTDDFTYTLNGGDTATVAIAVTCVDDNPVAIDDTATVAEDAPATTISVIANDTDPDGANQVQSVTQPANGTVVITNSGQDLTYEPDDDYCNDGSPTDDFTYTLSPGGDTGSVAVTVTCSNDAPALDLNGAGAGTGTTPSFTEDGGPVALAPNAELSDVDDTNIESATVTLTNKPDGNAEFLSADVSGTAITSAIYDSNTGVLTISGPDTLANYRQVLRSVTYQNTSDTPTTTARAVTFEVSDGDTDSNLATASLSVAVANDKPVVDLNGAAAGTGVEATFSEPGPAVTIAPDTTTSDPDDTNLASAQVKLTNAQNGNAESLTADASGTSITVTAYDSATGILALSGNASLADYQQVLRTVKYNNTATPPNATDRTVEFTVNDGDTDSDVATATVNVVPLNAAPQLDLDTNAPGSSDSSASFTEGSPAVAIAPNSSVTDADAGDQIVSAEVKITNLLDGASEVLTANVGATGITATYNAANGTLTLSGAKTPAEYEQVLETVKYDNTSDAPTTTSRSITVKVNDGDADSATRTATVSINAVNDAPTVDLNGAGGGTGATLNFTEGDAASAIGTATTVTDPDDTNIESATVTLTNRPDGNLESLSADTTGTSITAAAYNSANGVLALSGSDTNANYQQVLRSVKYANTDEDPSNTARSVEFKVNDGSADSNTATATVNVTQVNDAPAVDMNGGSGGIDSTVAFIEDSSPANVGSGPIALGPSAAVSDVDDTNIESATITLTNRPDGNGTESLQATVAGTSITATYTAATGVLSLSGSDSKANYQQVVRSVKYNNTSNTPTTTDRTVTTKVNDGSLDSPTANTTVTVTATNDAPVAVNDTLNGTDSAVGNTPLAVGTTQAQPRKVVDCTVPDSCSVLTRGTDDSDVDGPGPLTVGPTGNQAINTADGGKVTLEADGNFTYFPAPNDPGCTDNEDSFNYTLNDGGANGTSQGTVTIAVANCVWYLDSSQASNGTGIASSPFNSLAGINGAGGAGDSDGANDTIFVMNTGSYTGGLPLENNQRLFGPKFGLDFPGFTIVSPSGSTNPSISGGANSLGLASNNTVQAVDLGAPNAGGAALAGTSVGTAIMNNAANGSGAIAAGSQKAVDVSGGTVQMAFTNVDSSGSPTDGIRLDNTTGSFTAGSGSSIGNSTGEAVDITGTNSGDSVDFIYDGTISDTSGTAINISGQNVGTSTKDFNGAIGTAGTPAGSIALSNNNGATIRFDGGTILSTGANNAFSATGGGTVVVIDPNANGTAPDNTLASTTGTALNVANTTIGSGGLRFRSISSNGAASGIALNDTGSSGGLTVSGGGGTCSSVATCTGGAIQNTTAQGISLTNTQDPSFDRLLIQNTVRSGVQGTAVTNFSYTNGLIANSGVTAGDVVVGGLEDGNLAFNSGQGGTTRNLSGTVTITGNTLQRGYYHGVQIYNTTGTISDANISNNTVTSSTSVSASQGQGIHLVAFGNAGASASITKATIDNNTVTNIPSGVGIEAQGGNSASSGPSGTIGVPGSATNKIAITNNTISGQSAAARIGAEGIVASVQGGNSGSRSQANFEISNNDVTHTNGIGISNSTFGNSTATSTVSGNTIVSNNIFAAQGIGGGTGIVSVPSETPDMTMTVSNNNISQTDGNGILLVARDTSGILKARVLNNTVAAPLTGVRQGIRVDAGNSGLGEFDQVCLNISGNTSAESSPGALGIGLRRQASNATSENHAFSINGMAATSTPGVESYVNGLNPAGGGTLLISATSGFSNCSLP